MRSLSCLPFAVAALGAVAMSAASPVDAGTAHAAPAAAQSAPSRPAFTAEDRAGADIPGFRDVRFDADDVDAFRSALPQAKGPWLAFSAGGSDGAFGAGLMVGLGKANRRPDFAMVTGASTGALTATYTFVGRAYDKALEEGYTQLTAADVFEIGSTPEVSSTHGR